MRIRIVAVCLAAGLLLPWGAPAQSMMEYAGAAAGGSVGGVAGKKVSDGLTKILDKVDKRTEEAAKTPPAESRNKLKEAVEKDAAGKKPGKPAAAAEVTPSAGKGSLAPAFRPRWVGPKPPPEPEARPEAAAAAPAPAPPPPPAEEIGKIAPGTSRSDLLARAGAPAARISIPDEEGMLEIYHYRGSQPGTVRLRNGVVSEVRVEPR